jgi:alpha-L-rhamnosidase
MTARPMIALIALAIAASAVSPGGATIERAPLTPIALRCDGMVDPLGVDSSPPRLSWQLQGDGERGRRQSAWQVLVSMSRAVLDGDRGDVWDSGRVESAQQLHLPYGGRGLRSSEQVFWKVRVWDGEGGASGWSAPATWTMGVLEPGEWKGRWITAAGALGTIRHANGTLLLRRPFDVRPGLRRALASVCGLGHYEMTVNGARVGDGLLTPGWTAYDKACLYDTYDLTASLRVGANAVGLMLGSGLYSVQEGRYHKFVSPFRPLTALAQLRLEYDSGTVDFVGTDGQWRVAAGPIVFSNVYGGEDYDARLDPAGWDQPGFDDSAWSAAAVTDAPGPVLRGASQGSPSFRTYETFAPVAVRSLRPGVSVYDFGQNVSMMPRLRVRGAAGGRVRMIPAELLRGDGSVDRTSAGGGDAWWSYTLAGRAGGEHWFPRFFYHGSRYLQVERSAPPGAPFPEVERLESVVVHSDSPPAGEFACSSELFNRIRGLIHWAQRSNLAHVITDCPHRERLGWLEQYHLNGPALRYETDLTRLFAKTFVDMADAQQPSGLVPDIAPEYVVFDGGFRDSPEWGSAIVLAAWQHYVWTGDETPLRRNYEAMKRYVGYLASRAKDEIVDYGLGDWYDLGPGPPGESQLTPIALTATAIAFEDNQTLSRIARRLGHDEDAARYAESAVRIESAFNRRFLDASRSIYATGSQTAQAMPLVLVPEEHRARVLEALVRDVRGHRGATAGDVGYRYVLRALADGARSDVIFDMNNQSERPGYGYQLARGATSLTEAWDANPRSSQNHFMLGQIIEWFYGDLAGLAPDPDFPGFKRVRIRPQPVAGITWALAAHASPRGRVAVEWRRDKGVFLLEIELPPNTSAEVWMPAADVASVREGGRPVDRAAGIRVLRQDGDRVVFAVDSGRYAFSSPLEVH